jgi:lipopolysaccharide/colanic/teichoic acid biosynthesis glycosyltransferase
MCVVYVWYSRGERTRLNESLSCARFFCCAFCFFLVCFALFCVYFVVLAIFSRRKKSGKYWYGVSRYLARYRDFTILQIARNVEEGFWDSNIHV